MGQVTQNTNSQNDVQITISENVNPSNSAPSPMPQITPQTVSYPQIDKSLFNQSLQLIFNNQIDTFMRDVGLSILTKLGLCQIKDFILNSVRKYVPLKEHVVSFHQIGTIGSGFAMFDSDLHLVLVLSLSRYSNDAQKRKSHCKRDLNIVKWLIQSGLGIKIADVKIEEVASQGVMTPVMQLDLASLVNTEQQTLSNDIKYNKRKLTISINQWTGLAQCSLLAFLIKFDSRFYELSMIFLYWAKQNGFVNDEILTNAYGLSSYALNWMVVHFLQVASEPPILPPIERIVSIGREMGHKPIDIPDYPHQVDIFEMFDVDQIKARIGLTKNVHSTYELVTNLFEYYAFEFDYFNHIIDARAGCQVAKSTAKVEAISVMDPIAVYCELVQQTNQSFVESFKEEMMNFLSNRIVENDQSNRTIEHALNIAPQNNVSPYIEPRSDSSQSVSYAQMLSSTSDSQNSTPRKPESSIISPPDIISQITERNHSRWIDFEPTYSSSSSSSSNIDSEIINSQHHQRESFQPSSGSLEQQISWYRGSESDIFKCLQKATNDEFDLIVQQLCSYSIDDENNIQQITDSITDLLRKNGSFQSCVLHEIGTISCGLGLYNSELHFVLHSPYELSAPRMSTALENVMLTFDKTSKGAIQRQKVIVSQSNRGQTTIPALQLHFVTDLMNYQLGPKSRKVTISINQMAGLTQRSLLRFLNKYDYRFRLLNTIFLHWVKQNDFSECESFSSNFSMSTYAFTWMVVYYLQLTKPWILPSIKAIQSVGRKLGYKPVQYETIQNDFCDSILFDDFDSFDVDEVKLHIEPSENTQSVHELFVGLLNYYAHVFRYDHDVVCPRIGKKIISRAQLFQDRKDKFPVSHHQFRNYSSLCIEDPIMIKHNLGFGPNFAKVFQPKLSEFYKEYVKERTIAQYGELSYSKCLNQVKKCFANQIPPYFNIYTDGSKRDGKVGGAFVVLLGKKLHFEANFRLSDGCTIFQSEILSIRNAMKWCVKCDKSCVIISDCQVALQAICDPDTEDKLAVEIRKLLRLYPNHICLRWVKAHIDDEGNSLADHMAKEATNHKHISYELSVNGDFVEVPKPDETRENCDEPVKIAAKTTVPKKSPPRKAIPKNVIETENNSKKASSPKSIRKNNDASNISTTSISSKKVDVIETTKMFDAMTISENVDDSNIICPNYSTKEIPENVDEGANISSTSLPTTTIPENIDKITCSDSPKNISKNVFETNSTPKKASHKNGEKKNASSELVSENNVDENANISTTSISSNKFSENMSQTPESALTKSISKNVDETNKTSKISPTSKKIHKTKNETNNICQKYVCTRYVCKNVLKILNMTNLSCLESISKTNPVNVNETTTPSLTHEMESLSEKWAEFKKTLENKVTESTEMSTKVDSKKTICGKVGKNCQHSNKAQTNETNKFIAQVVNDKEEMPERFDQTKWREPIHINLGNSERDYQYISQLNITNRMVSYHKMDIIEFRQMFATDLTEEEFTQKIPETVELLQVDQTYITDIVNYLTSILKLSTKYYMKDLRVCEVGSIGLGVGVDSTDVHLMLHTGPSSDVLALNYTNQNKNVLKKRKEAHINELKQIATIIAGHIGQPLKYSIERQQSNRGMQIPVLQIEMDDLVNHELPNESSNLYVNGSYCTSRKLTISLNEINAHAQCDLIRSLLECCEHFRVLTILFLSWAKVHGFVNDESLTNANSLSSYALCLMVVYFLQITKKLPSVELLYSIHREHNLEDPLVLKDYPHELFFISPHNVDFIKSKIPQPKNPNSQSENNNSHTDSKLSQSGNKKPKTKNKNLQTENKNPDTETESKDLLFESKLSQPRNKFPQCGLKKPKTESNDLQTENKDPQIESKDLQFESNLSQSGKKNPPTNGKLPQSGSKNLKTNSKLSQPRNKLPQCGHKIPKTESKNPQTENKDPQIENKDLQAESDRAAELRKTTFDLLQDLLEFYAFNFDYRECAICPRSGQLNVAKRTLYEAKLAPLGEGASRFLSPMCIEDPLMLNCNLVDQQSKTFVNSFRHEMAKFYFMMMNFNDPYLPIEIDYQLTTYCEIEQKAKGDLTEKFIDDCIALEKYTLEEDICHAGMDEIVSFLSNVLCLNGWMELDDIGMINSSLGMYNSDLHLLLSFRPNLPDKFRLLFDLKKLHAFFENRFRNSITYKIIDGPHNRGLQIPVLQMNMADLVSSDQRELFGKDNRKSRRLNISINQCNGVAQQSLLRFLTKFDERFRYLVMYFVYWAKKSALVLDDSLSADGCASSYGLTLMVAFFLQVTKPAILPSVQKVKSFSEQLNVHLGLIEIVDYKFDNFQEYDVDKVKSLLNQSETNHKSTEQLIVELFKFYATKFDYVDNVVNPLSGQIKKKPKDNRKKALVIVDPTGDYELENHDKTFVNKLTKAMTKFLETAGN